MSAVCSGKNKTRILIHYALEFFLVKEPPFDTFPITFIADANKYFLISPFRIFFIPFFYDIEEGQAQNVLSLDGTPLTDPKVVFVFADSPINPIYISRWPFQTTERIIN